MFNKSNITVQDYALYLGQKVQTFTRVTTEKGKPMGYKVGQLVSVDSLTNTLDIWFGEDDIMTVTYELNEVKLILKRFPTNTYYNPNYFKHYLKAGYDIGVLPEGSYIFEGESVEEESNVYKGSLIDAFLAKAHNEAILNYKV